MIIAGNTFTAQQMMRYHALACDYDGTIATQGMVDTSVVKALKELSDSGRKLILNTGRRLEDLFEVFQPAEMFDYIVAENGAVLYKPAVKVAKLLATPAPKSFIRALRKNNITPLEIGHVVISTWHPNESTVLHIIQEQRLNLQILFNKGSVMILPPGVDKASGLEAALTELGLSRHNVVGVGDAENDMAFLTMCECSVAVANALPLLKDKADLVTTGEHGAGVIELIESILSDELLQSERSR